MTKIKAAIEKEKERRTNFINQQIQYLPSHFWPQLKDMPGTLSYESASKELELPDLRNCTDVKCEENLFGNLGAASSDSSDLDVKQMESLTEEVDLLKCKLLSKDQLINTLKQKAEGRTEEVAMLKQQIEKLNRTIKDMGSQQKLTIAFNQENLAKKTK